MAGDPSQEPILVPGVDDLVLGGPASLGGKHAVLHPTQLAGVMAVGVDHQFDAPIDGTSDHIGGSVEPVE